MRMNDPCNLNAPAGATPMTIADAILRECDKETLTEVLYYIDCYMKFYGEVRMTKKNFEDNFFDAAESEGEHG